MRRALLCLILLLTACTHSTPQSRPTPTSNPASTGLIVAVSKDTEGVELYRIGRDRLPGLLEKIPVPPIPSSLPRLPFGVSSISLGSGPRPVTCVVWDAR